MAPLEKLELDYLSQNPIPQEPEVFQATFARFARLYLYYNARLIDGDVDQDGGTQIRTIVQAVKKFGICLESLWPYDPSQVFVKPSDACYAQGLKHRVPDGYKLSQSSSSIKHCISSGYPVVFGISVFSSFMSEEVARTGIIPLPKDAEEFEGGHAISLVGYDPKNYIIRNSWGTSWGLGGYALMPAEYVESSELASDFWMFRRD